VSIVKGAQIRAARALLGWTRQQLAEAAGLHRNAVGYWETEDDIPSGTYAEPVGCRRIREALRKAGVEFLTRPAPGVRLCVKSTNKPHYARPRARPSWALTSARISPDINRSKTAGAVTRKAVQPLSEFCGAKTRSGQACRRKGIEPGRRCRSHGGLSTGPKSHEGRQRVAIAQKRRWAEYRRSRRAS